MKNKLFNKLIVLVIALPALACGLTGGDEPTATPAQPATAEVSATSTPTEPPPTPTIEVAPTTDITAGFVTYTSIETGITVQHPADWAVQDFFVLVIATDETLFDAPGAIQDGAGVVFAAGPADDFESSDPIDLANEAVLEFDLSEDATIVEGPTAVTIEGQQAAIAKVEGTPSETGIPLVGLAVVIINGDRVGVGLGITPKESEETYLPLIEAMFNTVVVGEPAEVPEVADNLPTLAGSTTISVGDLLASTLNENGIHDFIFTGQANTTVTFRIDPMEDDVDLVMEIFDTDLNSLIRQDDEFSGESERVVFAPPADGSYFIRVTDFYGSSGGFNIEVTAGGVQGTVDPDADRLEPNLLTAGALTGEPRQFIFTGTAGQPSTIFLIPDEDWDPTLTILGTDGTILVNEVDEGFSGESETISYTPEADGDYIVLADAFSQPEGGFSIFLVDPAFTFSTEGVVPAAGVQNYRICVPMNAFLLVLVQPADDFDAVININGAGGGQLIDQTDGGSSGDPEAVILKEGINPDAAFPVIVSVGGFGGQGGTFSVIITSTSSEGVVLDGC